MFSECASAGSWTESLSAIKASGAEDGRLLEGAPRVTALAEPASNHLADYMKRAALRAARIKGIRGRSPHLFFAALRARTACSAPTICADLHALNSEASGGARRDEREVCRRQGKCLRASRPYGSARVHATAALEHLNVKFLAQRSLIVVVV